MATVCITAVAYDPLGALWLLLQPQSVLPEQVRRLNRVATLDGGAVLNDYGLTAADLTLALRWTPASRAEHQALQRLVQPGLVRVATPEGLYLAGVERYSPGPGESSLTLLVTQQLDAAA